MTGFLLAAALLVIVTLLLLLRPWRRGGADRKVAASSALDINTSLYRDQLLELDRDLAAGTLAAADHAQSRAELQRRLLEDAGARDAPAAAAVGVRKTSLAIVLVVPLVAGSLYALLGQPAALDPRVRQGLTQADVEQMVQGLAARLEKNPDDPKGWAMLGRSYRLMGRTREAQAAFARVGPTINTDPVLLVEYADTLATTANGNLEGQPLALVERALALDPNQPMALALAATAAFKRQDFALAAQHWERLLPSLPPDSEDASWVASRLAEIRGAGAISGAAPAAAPVAGAVTAARAAMPPSISAAAPKSAPAASSEIRGRVSLAPALAAEVLPTDTVFVFARAVQGPRMPLALQRARVSELPLSFRLDDSSAMAPELKLSGATEVRIEARISRSGSATPAANDLIGVGPVVKPGAGDVSVLIDQRRP